MKSILTGQTMAYNQSEYTTRTRRDVGEIIATNSGTIYRVVAVGPMHAKYGQMILVERIGTRKRHIVRKP